jgi:P-type Ca2+ transporter type 2C
MRASETVPFDAMEKAIHQAYSINIQQDRRNEFVKIYEYPLEGKPPMNSYSLSSLHGNISTFIVNRNINYLLAY